MATEVHQFTATIPKNTPIATPVTVAFSLDNRVVTQVDIDVPPGPSFLLGFFLGHSGTQLIPYEVGEYIIWDDHQESWALEEFPTSDGWSLTGYNLSVAFDHSVAIRFHTEYPPVPTASTPVAPLTVIQTPATSPVVVL